MSESKAASVVFTNGSYLAGQAQTTAENAQSLANEAQTTADGKNKIYRGSSIEDAPKSGVVVGDLFFSSNDLYRYDGTSWEQVVSDTTGEETRAEVEKATSEAKDYSDSVKAQLEADAAKAQATADNITNYVQNSSGSSYLATLLNQSPSNASLSALVNGQVVSAINVSSSGDALIAGKKIMLDGDVTINGTAFASKLKATGITVDQLVAGSIDASKISVINLDAGSITTGTLNGVNINGAVFTANATLNKTEDKLSYTLNQTTTINGSGITSSGTSNDRTFNFSVNSTNLNMSNKIGQSIVNSLSVGLPISTTESTGPTMLITTGLAGDEPTAQTVIQATSISTPYISVGSGSAKQPAYEEGAISSHNVYADSLRTGYAGIDYAEIGPIHISYHHIRSDSTSIYVSNYNDSNFDSNGSIGFQVTGGIGLGASTIYTPTTDIYFQQGANIDVSMGWSYSRAAKTSIHCQNVISQAANTVASRLSVKTDITPVSYDRALAAVESTEMYDYQYINDDSGQHYVSGIIDDVHATPEYKIDDMLINKERTARIDANLIGYHHVVLQKLLERIDALEYQINKA